MLSNVLCETNERVYGVLPRGVSLHAPDEVLSA